MVRMIMNCINEDVLQQSGVDPCDWDCCELCWIAMINNGMEYIWDGVNLLVYDESEQEFVETHKRRWKPTKRIGITFEQCESGKWEVKA